MNERTFDPSRAHRLEDPQRLLWMPPEELVALLGLHPGMVIADIGAGTGYFALPFALAVAPGGMVQAVDLQPEMLALLEEKLRRQGAPPNIKLRQGSAAATGLADGSCDLAFLANIWHELDQPEEVLAEMRRILRPAGRIAIVDWRADIVPPPGPPADHRISAAAVEATLRSDGWRDVAASHFGQYTHMVTAVQ
jgi:ubiquinone/menaquinone biosynthesis C-methylase UbiE